MAYHVGKAEFAQLVEIALRDLPQQFAEFLEEVPIEIRTRPSRRQLHAVGLGDDDLLLGLYVGTNLADRSVEHSVRLPTVIFLFQEDIELVSDNADQLKHEVRTTVLHEIGHHFGLDEDDLERLGYG
jgi:predicted Zn-dependent protease with MMP-like domain